jgi:O-antigen/teichoic acid export membrane protein
VSQRETLTVRIETNWAAKGRKPMIGSVRKGVRRLTSALPTGTTSVGVGLAISSITAYAFVVIALNSLSGDTKAAFSGFWAVVFVIGPGFFLPLEQEVARALAHRRAQGVGGRPLVLRAIRMGAALTTILVVAVLVATPWLADAMFNGEDFFAFSLALSLVSFCMLHLTRGVLAGEGSFRSYGEVLAIDATVRMILAIGLAVLGVDSGGMYALCLGVSPLIALPIVLLRAKLRVAPGPDAPYSELSVNLGWLLGASVLVQLVSYAPLLGVNLLSTDADTAIVTGFASAFFVARLPILAFQAVQGTLLPKLAGLAGAGQHDEFRRGFSRLMVVVVGIAVAGTAGAFFLGPFVGGILFKDFTMSAGGLALLSAGSGVFIIALTIAQALVALGDHRVTTIAWSLGLIGSMIVMATVSGLELRVDLGFLVGSTISGVTMGIALFLEQRKMDSTEIGALVDVLEHEPLEL